MSSTFSTFMNFICTHHIVLKVSSRNLGLVDLHQPHLLWSSPTVLHYPHPRPSVLVLNHRGQSLCSVLHIAVVTSQCQGFLRSKPTLICKRKSIEAVCIGHFTKIYSKTWTLTGPLLMFPWERNFIHIEQVLAGSRNILGHAEINLRHVSQSSLNKSEQTSHYVL